MAVPVGRIDDATDGALGVVALGVHASADAARGVLVRRARVHLAGYAALGVLAVLVHLPADAALDVSARGQVISSLYWETCV